MFGLWVFVMAIPASAALLHRYPLDSDGSDSFGTANLTAVGGVTHDPTDGVVGGSAVFNAAAPTTAYWADKDAGSTFALLGDYDNVNGGMGKRPFTVALWAKTLQQGTSVCAFGLTTIGASTTDAVDGTYQHTGFFLRTSNGDIASRRPSVYSRGGGYNNQVTGATDIRYDGQWHQIVGVFGGTYRTVYVDGVKGETSNVFIPFTTNLPIRYITLGAMWRRNNQWVDQYTGKLDDVQVYKGGLTDAQIAYLYAFPGLTVNPASNPAPADQTETVPVTSTLSWTKGADPSATKAITGYYVYGDFGNAAGDPNLYLKATLGVADTDYGNQTGEMLGLGYGKTYHWRIDQAVNGSGPADPNTIPGDAWTFKTEYLIPTILTISPAKSKYDNGQTAQFTVTYISTSTVTGVQWYLNDAALDPATDSNISVTFTDAESTLTILSMSDTYAGTYTCAVTNPGGNSAPSGPAITAIKKLLAWYPFEQNGNDAAGSNHGILTGGSMGYVAGIIADSQAYAADPNGSNYFMLTTDAYPKAGYGNGLEEFTISCWILDSSTATTDTHVLGCPNDGYTTAFEFGITAANNLKHFYRDDDNTGLELNSSGRNLRDGQWHYIAATRSGNTVTLFVDGEAANSGNAAAIDTFSAWNHEVLLLADNVRGVHDRFFPGVVDDLRIYNYARSAEQIAMERYTVTGQSSCLSAPDAKYNLVNTGTSYCRVDLADFAEFTSGWMNCGLFPNCD
jgi:hypothetical protein